MINILHGSSPEVEHVLNFLGLKISDFIIKLSFKISSENFNYTYARWTDKTCTDISTESVSIPFNYETYLSILNLLGLEHDNFVSVVFELSSHSDLAKVIVEKEVSATKIKKQDFTLSELIERNGNAKSRYLRTREIFT